MFHNLKKSLNPFFGLEEFSTAEKIVHYAGAKLNIVKLFRSFQGNVDYLTQQNIEHTNKFLRENKIHDLAQIESVEIKIYDDEIAKQTEYLAKIIQNTWGVNYALYQKMDENCKKGIRHMIAQAFNGYTSTLNIPFQLRDIKKKSVKEFYGASKRDILVAVIAIEFTKASNFSEDELAAALKPVLQKLLVELIENDPSYFNGLQRLRENRSTYFSLLPEDLMKTTLHLFSPQNVAKPISLEDTDEKDNTPKPSNI